MIHLVFIEDHVLTRAGIGLLLSDEKEIQIVAEASTATEGVLLVKQYHPDLVLLDFKLPDQNGIEVTKQLLSLYPDLKILVLTATTQLIILNQLFKIGVMGYLHKNVHREELITAIQTVQSGQRYIQHKMRRHLDFKQSDLITGKILDRLSMSELEVMHCIIQGLTTKEITAHLKIKEKSVRAFRQKIFDKLNLKNDIDLMLFVIRSYLFSDQSSSKNLLTNPFSPLINELFGISS